MDKSKPHQKEEQIAAYFNKFYSPRDIKTSRMIIRKQVDKNGEAMVYIRLRRYDPLKKKDIIQRKIATDVRVKPRNWSSKKGEVLPKDFEYQKKNRIIKEKEASINKYIHNPDIDYIFAQLKKEEFLIIEQISPSIRLYKLKKSLVDYIESYYKRREKLEHPRGTVKEFKTVMNRIKRFDDYKGSKTFLEDINISWSNEFEEWLVQERYKDGTIEKTYTILKTVLYHYWDIKDEQNIRMSDKFMSKRFKRGKRSKNKPNPLTEEQLMALYNYSFSDNAHFEKIRKMILLQCFTGVRHGDLAKIRPQHIKDGFLEFTPRKTTNYDVEVEQPLNPYSKALLKEVGYDTSCYKMENQPYNVGIKDLFKKIAQMDKFKKLKFRTDYTSHNFRDTFISLAVQKGVNWKSILKWVGQSSYTIMDRYIKLSKPFDVSEMKKVFDQK